MHFSVNIGNLTLYNYTLLNQNKCLHFKQRFYIDSNQSSSLCFTGYDNSTIPDNCNHGPLVDNITLNKI